MSDEHAKQTADSEGTSLPGSTMALYTTHGELKHAIPEGAPERDERVSELFGQQVALARSASGPTYAAVKLAEGSRRPQTYYVAVYGMDTPTFDDVRRALDQLVDSSEFRRTTPSSGSLADVAASLLNADPTDLSATDESERNVVDALSWGTPLRFETGDPAHALTLLEVACGEGYDAVVSIETAVGSDEGPRVESADLVVGWHGSRSDATPSDETERRMKRAAERRRERAISDELAQVDEAVDALADLGLDDREIRERVTDRLPHVASTEATLGSTGGHPASGTRGPDGLHRFVLPIVAVVLLGTLGGGGVFLVQTDSLPSAPSLSTVSGVDVGVLPWVAGAALFLFVALGASITFHRQRGR